MKKTILAVYLFVLLIGLVHTAGITVTSPTSGTNWTAGSTQTISWKCPGCTSPDVKINVFRDAIQQANFLLQLTGKNTGKMNWKIPANFQTGKYILRIKEATGKNTGDSRVFTITGNQAPPPPVQTLSVKYPNGGEKLSRNYFSTITWESKGITGNLTLELWKGGRKYGTIAGNIPGSQQMYKWKAGDMFGTPPAGAGDDYRIKIFGSGKEDMSNNFFSITDIPGIVSNQNNVFNNTRTFQNPPQQTYFVATPPVIEEVKVESFDKKYPGQVEFGNNFEVKVLLKNTSKTVMKNNWNVVIKFNKFTIDTILVKGAIYPKKPGESWWEKSKLVNSGGYNFIENKNAFHRISAIIGNDTKSTLIGIVKHEEIALPEILSFQIWNNDCSCWSNNATHKPGAAYKVQLDVKNVYKITIKNKTTGKVLATRYLQPYNGRSEVSLTADDSGEIQLTADSPENRFATASVQLKTSGPLTLPPKYLKFDMWRAGSHVKTEGMVSGYRTVKLIEISNNSTERVLKELKARMLQSSPLDWELFFVGFPIKLKLHVVYLDYSQESIIRIIQ